MKTRHIAFAALALTAIACAPNGAADDNADQSTGAATTNASDMTVETITIGSISLMKNHIHTKVKAKNAPDEFRPDFDSCETEANFYQIAGTQHDKEINDILRGQWQIPTADSCEDAENYWADAHVVLLDDVQGILSLNEPESWDGGGAHPNYGMEFKNIDLRTGKLITLADYVLPDAAPKLQVLVNQKVATELQRVDLDKPTFDAQGKKHTYTVQKLDQETQDMMRDFTGYYFSTYENNTSRPSKPEEMTDFNLAGTGIRVDLVNQLPHAMQGLPASFKLLWNDLKTAGVLRDDSDLIQRTKDARARQLTVKATPQ